MDVYHKVLIKLYEATGGRESDSVDLRELVKKEGYLGSYSQIKEHLSGQSWITETSRADAVKITHWGVKEAKSTQSAGGDTSAAVKKDAVRLVAETRELVIFLEELAADLGPESLARAEKKLAEINAAILKLKSSVQ